MKMENQYRQKKLVNYILAAQKYLFLVRWSSIDLFCDYFCPWGRIFASVCHKSYFWRGGGILPSCFSDSSVVYATSCGERWDAFKTAREPVLGSANPLFFSSRIEKKL